MPNSPAPSEPPCRPEPRWPAVVALLAVGGLYLALPDPLTPGPNWLLLALLAAVEAPGLVFHRLGRQRVTRALGLIASSLITAALVWSLAALIEKLLSHRELPITLLRGAVALWFSNILVFAAWYWRLDAGGPHQRDRRPGHTEGAFLFPQMVLPKHGQRGWSPGFVDYLFLAFNTSTAFSPTDVPVLSRWAKGLMMLQSLISLGTIAILAARAVNIL
jgi:hypothetical protein